MDIPSCWKKSLRSSTLCSASLINNKQRPSPNGGRASNKRKITMETVIRKQVVVSDMKQRLADINLSVSWMDFANKYFHKSSSWFYHKLNGIDGNGGTGGFNKEEIEQLRGSLFDLSNRIRRAAESI